jgi:hypothetical protein
MLGKLYLKENIYKNKNKNNNPIRIIKSKEKFK